MKDNRRPGQMMKLKTVEELLGVVNEESAMEIEIYLISGFKDHPFHIVDDDRMQELVESIKANGVLTPVVIRPKELGRYEMISGHRRMHAAQLAGLERIPAFIREMTDDEATIMMVDSNIQREELLPSEKAFAFKMKMDAMRHQGTCRHDVDKSESVAERKTANIVGEGSGIAARSVQRYIRLTELIPELLEMVDNKRVQFTVGVEISYINKDVQKWLCEYIHDNGVVKLEQIQALRKRLETGMVNQSQMIMVLNDSLKGRLPSNNVTFTEKKLRKYFPNTYTAEDMESIITALLEEWKKTHGGD